MKTPPIGELFLSEGLIDEKTLDLALLEQVKSGERLGLRLVKLGCISENDNIKILSTQLGIPFISSLKDYPSAPPTLESPPTLKFLRHYKVVPIKRHEGVLQVAVADPLNHFPIEALSFSTGLKMDVVLGTEPDILDTIESYYGSNTTSMERIIEGIEEKDSASAFDIDDVEQLTDMAQEAPVINLVNVLIAKAIESKASDVHIEPYEDILDIRYRVDGLMHTVESMPRRLHPAVSSRIKIMSKLNIAERRLPQDGRFKLKLDGKQIDIRVSTVPTQFGESVVMRLLDPEGILSLESIGLSESIMTPFTDLINQPHGMVLVTGPTGSGKSTTLYAALSRIDIITKKVITIEDPIEYQLEGVNQIQAKPKIGLTFASGLRSIVRQDPDIVMIGEIRDSETADIAIHSALTGHMILSTLHTNDAPSATTRLIDMGVESYLISSSLLGVLAQRLVRVICPDCKVSYHPDEKVCKIIDAELGQRTKSKKNKLTLYKGTGCASCNNTGFKGRTGIFELMTVTDEIKHLISEKISSDKIRKMAKKQGMTTLREDGLEKVVNGVTTFEEVIRVTLE